MLLMQSVSVRVLTRQSFTNRGRAVHAQLRGAIRAWRVLAGGVREQRIDEPGARGAPTEQRISEPGARVAAREQRSAEPGARGAAREQSGA